MRGVQSGGDGKSQPFREGTVASPGGHHEILSIETVTRGGGHKYIQATWRQWVGPRSFGICCQEQTPPLRGENDGYEGLFKVLILAAFTAGGGASRPIPAALIRLTVAST